MQQSAPIAVDRPLRLAEVLARAIELYGRSTINLVIVGALQAGAFLTVLVIPWYGRLAVAALLFVVSFALVVRLAAGDRLGPATGEVLRNLPLLIPLAFVVAVPFYAGLYAVELLVVSLAWLGLTAFAVPVAMLELAPERGSFDRLPERLAKTLRRTVVLAQADFMHAVGVAVVLVLIYLLLGNVLVGALFGFADQGKVAAPAIVQAVLAPFFFLGLTVLYLEQRIRAEERRRPRRR